MRNKAVSLVLIFLASLFGGLVQAQTPDAVTVDGDLVDWPADTLMQTDSNGVDFRLTWNESHLFLGWEGTDWKADFEGADLFVYLNTTQGGSVLARDWGLLTPSRSLLTMASFLRTTRTINTFPMMGVRGLTGLQRSIFTLGGPTTR